MYTLILSAFLYAGQYNALASSASVTPIHGFESQQACLDAGNAWLAQQRQAGARGTLRALCVRQAVQTKDNR